MKTAPHAKSKRSKKGRPRRPLHAYNLFFAMERKNVIHELQAQEEMTGEPQSTRDRFAKITRMISKQWKNIDPVYKEMLEEKARIENAKFKKEKNKWEMDQALEEMEKCLEVEQNKVNGLSFALKQTQIQREPTTTRVSPCPSITAEQAQEYLNISAVATKEEAIAFFKQITVEHTARKEAVEFLKQKAHTLHEDYSVSFCFGDTALVHPNRHCTMLPPSPFWTAVSPTAGPAADVDLS
jgi:hypothetical protein